MVPPRLASRTIRHAAAVIRPAGTVCGDIFYILGRLSVTFVSTCREDDIYDTRDADLAIGDGVRGHADAGGLLISGSSRRRRGTGRRHSGVSAGGAPSGTGAA